jgi:hypothetical protein
MNAQTTNKESGLRCRMKMKTRGNNLATEVDVLPAHIHPSLRSLYSVPDSLIVQASRHFTAVYQHFAVATPLL